LAKLEASWPVVGDPSHATGRTDLVIPAARAAIAAGADGLIVEVHPNPAEAWSDGDQSLNLGEFSELVRQIGKISVAMDRKFEGF